MRPSLDGTGFVRPHRSDQFRRDFMRRKAALLAFALVGLSGCTQVSQFLSRQYYPAQPKYVVFYSPWSTTLDENGLSVVAGAAQLALKEPASTVQVVGFASTVGPMTPTSRSRRRAPRRWRPSLSPMASMPAVSRAWRAAPRPTSSAQPRRGASRLLSSRPVSEGGCGYFHCHGHREKGMKAGG